MRAEQVSLVRVLQCPIRSLDPRHYLGGGIHDYDCLCTYQQARNEGLDEAFARKQAFAPDVTYQLEWHNGSDLMLVSDANVRAVFRFAEKATPGELAAWVAERMIWTEFLDDPDGHAVVDELCSASAHLTLTAQALEAEIVAIYGDTQIPGDPAGPTKEGTTHGT